MKYSYLPDSFLEFKKIFDILNKYKPKNISIVGSYGDKFKTPKKHSDLDILFVYETNEIFKVNEKIKNEIKKIKKIKLIELGVHYQFGFVCSIYFENNPKKWIDLGIMDLNFANNYLVDFPKTDIKGIITNSKNKEIPNNHLNHLSRKILKLLKKNKILQAKIASYRYLNWLNVEQKILKIKNLETDNYFFDLYNDNIKFDDNLILEYVKSKIKIREPNIWKNWS